MPAECKCGKVREGAEMDWLGLELGVSDAAWLGAGTEREEGAEKEGDDGPPPLIDDVCTYIPFHGIYKGGEDLLFGLASELLQGPQKWPFGAGGR